MQHSAPAQEEAHLFLARTLVQRICFRSRCRAIVKSSQAARYTTVTATRTRVAVPVARGSPTGSTRGERYVPLSQEREMQAKSSGVSERRRRGTRVLVIPRDRSLAIIERDTRLRNPHRVTRARCIAKCRTRMRELIRVFHARASQLPRLLFVSAFAPSFPPVIHPLTRPLFRARFRDSFLAFSFCYPIVALD